MTNFKKISLSLAVATALSLGGCGSSSSGTTPAGDEDDNTNNSTVSGKVADGYLDKAKVCLDKNENGKCDTDEPNTLSVNGQYDLSITITDIGKYPILVEVTTSTIDLDDGNNIVNGYTLTTPKDSTEFISPITTLIQNEILKCPVLTKEEATSKVSKKLDLTSTNTKLLTDYVANNSDSESSKLHEVGKVIATLQGELELKTTQGAVLTDDNKKATMSKILDNIYSDINNTSSQIANGTLASAIDTTTKVTNTNITSEDVSIAVKDLALKQNGTIDKFSGLKNSIYFGFEHNENTNAIEIEAAVFDDDSWDYGRDDFSNGVNAINTSETNIGNPSPITTNANGEIEYTNEDLKHPKFSLISLKDKSYTVKEIITIMQDGYSVELSKLDQSKLSNTINFTDDSDKFYMFIVKKKSNNEYIRSIYKVSKSAMTKIVTALQ
jgi:hypothetical protein